jgi:two-component system nitrogen regulation sensor histidine kinase NtrY
VEADPKRVGSGQITAKVSAKADAVHITVIDNGCGLPDENRDRLVEPYMTTRTKGTGLGLAIVQRITEQHGGKLRLADAPKRNGKLQGASVRIDLPVLDHDELEMDDDTPVPASSANASEPAEDEEGVSHGV